MNLHHMNPTKNSFMNLATVHLELQSFPDRLYPAGVSFMKRTCPVKSPLEAGKYTNEIHSSAADDTVRSTHPITDFDDNKSPMPASILKKRRYERRNSVTANMLQKSSSTLAEGNHAHFSSEDLAEQPVVKRRFQRRNSATAAMLIAGLRPSEGERTGK